MIASGEAPVRSKAGALLSPATLVISSFITHSYPLKGHDNDLFDGSFLTSFAPFFSRITL
jgi:hypothetical protein